MNKKYYEVWTQDEWNILQEMIYDAGGTGNKELCQEYLEKNNQLNEYVLVYTIK